MFPNLGKVLGGTWWAGCGTVWERWETEIRLFCRRGLGLVPECALDADDQYRVLLRVATVCDWLVHKALAVDRVGVLHQTFVPACSSGTED